MESRNGQDRTDISKIFGSKVFNDQVMSSRLPSHIYKSLKDTSKLGKPLDKSVAMVVATAMKDWAIENGATHYTHWFQPMNNLAAGKHDSFLSLADDGRAFIEFSPKALVKGEPDASSFPSGGLRATFEARGYTTWDPTSPAFVKDGTLYIPTAFCSYTGEALDAKTPLLRSMAALNEQGLRILRHLGNQDASLVTATVGAEQEYFLIDRDKYEKRLDLKLCGRTLMGARPPKGQELDDHYCGRIRLRVAEFMRELDETLWSYGIAAKTKHNEVAPAQHELAPVFETVNIACDHNLLTMEIMREVAKKQGLACLLHEKPFYGINGSGKHDNFSITTNTGINFLRPGKNPQENMLFLLTVCAVLQAADDYADLIRLAAATPGNDQRLGGFEAPPSIISVFLGEQLTQLLADVAHGDNPGRRPAQLIETGVTTLPNPAKDDSDRNRTSPFAFTGNKFEFRMLGSSQSIAFCNVVLNTAVAESFRIFADRLDQAADKAQELRAIIVDTLQNHGRIIFNGNNYSQEWVEEAKRRGLPVINRSVDSYEAMTAPKNLELFRQHKVLTDIECVSRKEVFLENYVKVRAIEAETMIHMVRRQVLPAVTAYAGELAGSYSGLTAAGLPNNRIEALLTQLSELISSISDTVSLLEQREADITGSLPRKVDIITDKVAPVMEKLRADCDQAEMLVPFDHWPMPTYIDLLHRI